MRLLTARVLMCSCVRARARVRVRGVGMRVLAFVWRSVGLLVRLFVCPFVLVCVRVLAWENVARLLGGATVDEREPERVRWREHRERVRARV